MKVATLKRLIEGMDDEANITIQDQRKITWKSFAWSLGGYAAGYCLIRFLLQGSAAEAVIGGWIIQFIWTRD